MTPNHASFSSNYVDTSFFMVFGLCPGAWKLGGSGIEPKVPSMHLRCSQLLEYLSGLRNKFGVVVFNCLYQCQIKNSSKKVGDPSTRVKEWKTLVLSLSPWSLRKQTKE